MHPRFFSRKKEKPVFFIDKNGGTHNYNFITYKNLNKTNY